MFDFFLLYELDVISSSIPCFRPWNNIVHEILLAVLYWGYFVGWYLFFGCGEILSSFYKIYFFFFFSY